MVFHTSAAIATRWRRIRHLALIVVSLAVAHEAVYAARVGEVLSVIGDEEHRYWHAFLIVAVVALVVLAVGWWRRISTTARRAAAAGPSDNQSSGFAGEMKAILVRLAPAVGSAFLVLENVEHLVAHGHIEGMGVYMAPGSELTLPIVLAVVATIASIGALVRWREVCLIARLRTIRARRLRIAPASPPTPGWDITAALVRLSLLLSGDDWGRAPPAPRQA